MCIRDRCSNKSFSLSNMFLSFNFFSQDKTNFSRHVVADRDFARDEVFADAVVDALVVPQRMMMLSSVESRLASCWS